jgi:hypothetical protein
LTKPRSNKNLSTRQADPQLGKGNAAIEERRRCRANTPQSDHHFAGTLASLAD